MQDIVTICSLVAGFICLLVFIVKLFAAGSDDPHSEVKALAVSAKALTPTANVTGKDYAAILEAIAKIGDVLVKATPAVAAVIAAVLFFANATVASGVLRS